MSLPPYNGALPSRVEIVQLGESRLTDEPFEQQTNADPQKHIAEPLSPMDRLLADLEARRTIHEQPFHSSVPIVGPIVAWFRTMWNNISTRWYVLPLLQQQSEFNALLITYLRGTEAAAAARRDMVDGWMREMSGRLNEMSGRLNEMDSKLKEMGGILSEVDTRTIGTDQDQTQLTKNVAELSYQLTRLIRLPDEMDLTEHLDEE
jgi:hypothetical protein